MRTAPKPVPEASHSTTMVTVKFGSRKTGGDILASLSLAKAVVAARVHEKAYFFKRTVRGAASMP
jgi:hypothetical protein